MVVLACILFVLIIVGVFFLMRFSGRFGQRPEPVERSRHNSNDVHPRGPRATGIN